MLIIDASVAVKASVVEEGSEKAAGIIASGEWLMAPAHMFAEFGEVLIRKHRLGQIAGRQVASALDHLAASVVSLPLPPLNATALAVATATGASVYDCLYVALAASENCPLVTADRRLIAKMAETEYAPLMVPLDSFTASP